MARLKPSLTLEAGLPAGQKPTLKTIAQISGLAVPTVSRALNDAPDIGSDTKVLVRKIADEIGYVPNRAGVRLRTGRTNVISLIMSTEHDTHTANLISSVAGALQDTPYHLNVTPYFPEDDIMKPVRYIVETGSADAVIINQTETEDARIAYLMEKRFPFASHGRSKWSDLHPYYDFDNHAFGVQAMSALHAKGRRNIMVIAPPLVQNYAQHFVAGLQETAERYDLKATTLANVTSDDGVHKVIARVKAGLQADRSIDGIAVASTASAVAAVAGLEQLGMTLGTEIDVVGKDAASFLTLFRAEMLTLPEEVGTAGTFLAKAVINAIRNPEAPPMQFLEVPKAGAY